MLNLQNLRLCDHRKPLFINWRYQLPWALINISEYIAALVDMISDNQQNIQQKLSISQMGNFYHLAKFMYQFSTYFATNQCLNSKLNEDLCARRMYQGQEKVITSYGRMYLFVPVLDTVETLYNTVNFCWSTHKRHSIARPKGRGMGCLLWVQRATYCVDLSILSSIKYLL